MTRACSLWSGPRNVSTALMYSFAQRDDIRVVDEPLYGHYLSVSGADHPGRGDVLDAMNCDGKEVIDGLLLEQERLAPKRLFLKQMAHHLRDIDTAFLGSFDNVLLIRDPRDMLPSLNIQIPGATLADTGIKRQWELFSELRDIGMAPAVLDSRELLSEPESVLSQLCASLGLEFDPGMLHWTAGPRPEDGVWAKHWYHAVHKSTGFSKYRAKPEFPDRLKPLLGQCLPWYEKLMAFAIRA